MQTREAVFIYTPELEKFSYPEDSPFKTRRAGLARQVVHSMGLLSGDGRSEQPPVPASRRALETFHTPRYIDALQAASAGHLEAAMLHMGLGSPDCPVFHDLYDYAALASGATLTGASLILDKRAFVAFNPSGGFHHAQPELAAGFCYINDVVLACMNLAAAGCRVAFVDLDVHHCDGVQNAFYGRRDVMTISLHESGKTLFPGTGFEYEIGEGEGKGYTVNVPLPVGTYDEAYVRAFRRVALPLLHAFNPDVIVLELGMDGLAGDPLAHLNLTNNAYAEPVELIMGFGKPILATGGGGYHVQNTTRGWALMWSILSGAGTQSDLSIGLGGVMLQSTEWRGGLRDRVLISHAGQRASVDDAIAQVINTVERYVFPIHHI